MPGRDGSQSPVGRETGRFVWAREVGYIANGGNFKDHVTDKSGAVFLKTLLRQPRQLRELVDGIAATYKKADVGIIEQDAKDFYALLEDDGFIVFGFTFTELDSKDRRFSYSELMPETIRQDFTPDIFRADKDTQDYIANHFKNNPQLVQLQIELTSRCNERCIHCSFRMKTRLTISIRRFFTACLTGAVKWGF